MNAKVSGFVVYVEVIIDLVLYSLHGESLHESWGKRFY